MPSYLDSVSFPPPRTQGNDKAKLAAMLKEAMANERLCTQEACECFLAGVPCHADVCGCCAGGGKRGKLDCCNPKVWKSSHSLRLPSVAFSSP